MPLTVSCFGKIQIGFTLLVCVCVCARVCVTAIYCLQLTIKNAEVQKSKYMAKTSNCGKSQSQYCNMLDANYANFIRYLQILILLSSIILSS